MSKNTIERNPREAKGKGLSMTRTVRGNIEMGRRPYVQLYGIRYTNQHLQANSHLIGQRILTRADCDKGIIKAYLEDGSFVGVLKPRETRFQKTLIR